MRAHLNPPPRSIEFGDPLISSAGTSEEWQYFLNHWAEYKTVTKISGTDQVIRLLECSDEQLQKNLTHTAGGSLTNTPEADVLAAI